MRQHSSQGHQSLEEMPSLQTLGGTTVRALSRDHHQGDFQVAETQELHALSPYPPRSTRGDERLLPEKHGLPLQDRQDRKCIILEAVVASIIVIGVVLGAVLGTQLSSRAHSSASTPTSSSMPTPTPTSSRTSSSLPSNTAVLRPSAKTIPIGSTFNVSITVGGNCTGSETCASPESGGYTAGVSQNLFGDGTDSQAWSCGTCWQLTTLWGVTSSSSIVVHVVKDCPATTGNDLCMMKTLDDENVHGMNVDVNLCPDSGAPQALLGSEQLGLGQATRVRC